MEFLDCRDRGHAWVDPHPKELEVQLFEMRGPSLIRTLVCMRCKTQRVEEFDRQGARVKGTRYHYAKGYLLRRGEGRRGRSQFRRDVIRAVLKTMKGAA